MASTSSRLPSAALLLSIGMLGACATGSPHAASGAALKDGLPVTSKSGACPQGHDYGSGIVALEFPPKVYEAFAQAHDLVAQRHPDLVLTSHEAAVYAPHVSLVYGVTNENRDAIVDYLVRSDAAPERVEVQVEDLRFWDAAKGDKTYMVVTLADASRSMQRLNQDLRRLILQQAPPYPYQPHVTLAYLRHGTRPDTASIDMVKGQMALVRGKASVLMLTNRCGLPAGYIGLRDVQ